MAGTAILTPMWSLAACNTGFSPKTDARWLSVAIRSPGRVRAKLIFGGCHCRVQRNPALTDGPIFGYGIGHERMRQVNAEEKRHETKYG